MFFLLKKKMSETRNFAVSFSESGKVFILRATERKNRLILFTEKL